MSEREKFFAELHEQERPVAIKFRREQYDLGMYFLMRHSGRAAIWGLKDSAGKVVETCFIVKNIHLKQAAEDLTRAEVEYEFYDLPDLRYVTLNNLGIADGWKKPIA